MYNYKTHLLDIFCIKLFLYYTASSDGMYYVNRLGNRNHVYSLNPVWERQLESDGLNPGIDNNVILFKESHDTTNLEDERFVHPLETKYPRLDILAEEHF